jgi:transaldolase
MLLPRKGRGSRLLWWPPGEGLVSGMAGELARRWTIKARKLPHNRSQTIWLERTLRDSPGWRRALSPGLHPQRLLSATTGTTDPHASDVLYVKALAAPFIVNTMPHATLERFCRPRRSRPSLPADGGDGEEVLAQFGKAGIDIDAWAANLQDEDAKPFVQSWNDPKGRAPRRVLR